MRPQIRRMTQGDTPSWPYTVTQRDPVTGVEVPVVLTGSTIHFTAKRRRTDADPGVFQKSIGSGITIVDGAAGRLEVKLAKADTAGLEAPIVLHYDLQLSTPAGDVLTVAEGPLRIRRGVTATG